MLRWLDLLLSYLDNLYALEKTQMIVETRKLGSRFISLCDIYEESLSKFKKVQIFDTCQSL